MILYSQMKEYFQKFIKVFEILLAALVLLAVIYFGFSSIGGFLGKDWSNIAIFYQFISYILLLLVGVELIRLIVLHSITTVLELMILIVARKMLSPDLDSLGLLYNVVALAILVGINYVYALKPLKSLDDLTS